MNTLLNKILFPAAIIGTAATINIINIKPAQSVDVAKIAEQVTVLIKGSGSAGSGVIVAKENNTYYVLTAAHVIDGTKPGEEADVVTLDQEPHFIDTNNMVKFPGYDLAVVKFESKKTYKIAEVANSNDVTRLMSVFVAGFPLPGQAIEAGFFITDGKISNINPENADGYHLVYTSPTRKGMSGGPVFNSAGQVIGIHGRAEGNANEGKEQGFNLGIPVNIFQQEMKKAGLNLNLQIAKGSPQPVVLEDVTPVRGAFGRPPTVESKPTNVVCPGNVCN